MSAAGLALPKLLTACTEDGASGDASADAEANAEASPDTSVAEDDTSTAEEDASSAEEPDTSVAEEDDASDVPWASGGTKAMTADYPDPFADGGASMCTLTKAMILGPCYADTLVREDVSEGVAGVPLRLSFLVVRAEDCSPVPDATVDIWHTNAGGYYSEFAVATTCNPGQEDSSEEKFCRGVQTTNSEGRVDFSSVIPGWYSGRAVHIHFTVRVNDEEYLTSQLFFEDSLLDEIEQQVDYEARGTRDTRNTQDSILPADDPGPFVFDYAKRSDGALHAWKVLALRSSLDEELPSAGGIGGGGFDLGDGGFPGGFPGGGALPDGDGGLPPGFPGLDGGGQVP